MINYKLTKFLIFFRLDIHHWTEEVTRARIHETNGVGNSGNRKYILETYELQMITPEDPTSPGYNDEHEKIN